MSYDRGIECANSNGGNTEIYLLPFVKYNRSQIKYEGNYITEFPYSAIFLLESPLVSFSENISHEDGGVEFNQSVSFQLNKILDTDNYIGFAAVDWRIIAKDSNGNYRMIGTHTGLKGKYTKETGGDKPDFNGFKFTFETKEEKTAGFLQDLSGFDINGELSLDSLLEMLL
jgi:hypothetical protein